MVLAPCAQNLKMLSEVGFQRAPRHQCRRHHCVAERLLVALVQLVVRRLVVVCGDEQCGRGYEKVVCKSPGVLKEICSLLPLTRSPGGSLGRALTATVLRTSTVFGAGFGPDLGVIYMLIGASSLKHSWAKEGRLPL